MADSRAGKLIAAVVDEQTSRNRLKHLIKDYGKREALTLVEPITDLNLLQISVVVGNLSAAEYLLSLGSDLNVRLDHGAICLSPTPPAAVYYAHIPPLQYRRLHVKCFNIARPCRALDTWMHAKLSLLHLAALAGQEGMVRWLVEKCGLGVDTRAGVTGATPLMAVVTRCCVPTAALGDTSTVGRLICDESHALELKPQLGLMISLQPMARLLLALGADRTAVDSTGNNFMAAAAAAGVDGMFKYVTTPEMNILQGRPLSCLPGQAGHILTACVSAQDPRGGVFSEARCAAMAIKSISWLSEQFKDMVSSQSPRWVGEINSRLTKRSAAYGRPTPPERFHTSPLLEAATSSRPDSTRATLQLLLEVGCAINLLLPGAGLDDVDLPLVSWWVIYKHSAKVAGPRWQQTNLVLLAMCARTAPSAEQYAAALRALQQHGGGTDLKYPVRYNVMDIHGRGTRSVEVNLLLRAVACDTAHALLGVCQVLDERPDGQDILALYAPGLLIAAVRDGRLGHCRALLDRGAEVLLPDESGVHALWAAVTAREEAAEKASLLFATLRSRFAAQPDKWEELPQRLAAEGPGGMSLVQWAVAHRAHGLVKHLEAMGVQLNVAYKGGDPPLRTACTGGHNELVQLLVAPSQSGPALRAALQARTREHGLTVLGSVVAWGYVRTMDILAAACRREGLELAPLLERHSPRSAYHLPLFTAVVHNYPGMLQQLLDHGLELIPEITTEHMEVSNTSSSEPVDAKAPTASGRRELVPTEDASGRTESLTLLMCAASVGNHEAVETLLIQGSDPRERPFPGNCWYVDAVTAAIDFPELAHFLGGEDADSSGPCMGSGQLLCVLMMLTLGGALTEEQLSKVLAALPQVDDVKVAKQLWSFLRRHAAQCGACELIGKWRKCGQCTKAYYCGIDCQRQAWPLHSQSCTAAIQLMEASPE